MKINGQISICGGRTTPRDGKVKIEVRDADSGTLFCEIAMTDSQFIEAAMGGLAQQECECEVFNLERVGKKMEMDTLTFEMPKVEYDERDFAANTAAVAACPAGWVPDLYFGSQTSFFRDGEKQMARTTIRRWV